VYSFFHNDSCVCEQCEKKLKPLFLKFRVVDIAALAIYQYDEEIKTLLYQVKGCYDVELAEVFFSRFKAELHHLFKGFILVPAPSSKSDDKEREFNHVEAIFKPLKLPFLFLIEKAFPYKQAELNARQRTKAKTRMKLITNNKMYGKKILIIDDVYTTGSTIKGMIGLIKPLKPKKIMVMVMSKTFLK